MSPTGPAGDDPAFVRTYVLTRGRTRARHDLHVDTVLDAGPGQPGPDRAHACEEILALCRERRRSVTELAGLLHRPVTAVKILISDLLDVDALTVPVTAPYAATGTHGDGAPATQLLAALLTGLKRKWPDAHAYPQAG
ncbi:DUF742 domain-containing protein [Streptomyces sp. NPDC058417]|uniref:DUF742 domain-containing protein n=1 Tax=unclassified Streptomyces TaxID=2593676 RepID=UPI00365DBDDC